MIRRKTMPNLFYKTYFPAKWSRSISWINCAASTQSATTWRGDSPTSSREDGIKSWCFQNTGQRSLRPALSWSSSRRRPLSKGTEGKNSSRSLETSSSKWSGGTCKRRIAYITHRRRLSCYRYSSYKMWDSGWPVRCLCSYRNVLSWRN